MYQVLFQFQSLEDLVNWNKQFGKLANKKPVTIEQNKNDKPDNRGTIKRIQPYLIVNALSKFLKIKFKNINCLLSLLFKK